MKNKSGWKKVSENMIGIVQLIDLSMQKNKKSLSSVNKAIKDVTGIRTNQTIRHIRESNYDFAAYKDLIRVKNPSAYDEKPIIIKLDDIRKSWYNIVNVLDRKNSKIAAFLTNANLPHYNGKVLVIELINTHKFHIKALEKDVEEIESAIKEVLGREIKVKFHIKPSYSSNLNIQPVEENHEENIFKDFLKTDLTFASKEESYVFYYLNEQGISSIEKISILNNLITTFLILAKEDFKQ